MRGNDGSYSPASWQRPDFTLTYCLPSNLIMLTDLFAVISRTVELSAADEARCARYFEPLTLKKNTLVAAAGQVPLHLYFVRAGYLRLYYPEADGREATTYLGAPGEFLTPFLSFIHQRPALESLASVTAAEVLRIAQPALQVLIAESEAFKSFSLLIFEQAITTVEQRAHSLATRTAEQRYRQLLATRPDVLLHVPVQHVASYLGMQPESLSRIRRQALS